MNIESRNLLLEDAATSVANSYDADEIPPTPEEVDATLAEVKVKVLARFQDKDDE